MGNINTFKEQMGKTIQKKTGKGKKPNFTFEVNCEMQVTDGCIVVKDFANYLSNNIKVEGKKANLGKAVTVDSNSFSVIVKATIPFSKRYVKYLTKKYLRKTFAEDRYIRVIALNKNAYQLRYINTGADEE